MNALVVSLISFAWFSAAETCSYNAAWGRKFDTTFPFGDIEETSLYGACTNVRVSCGDMERFNSSMYKSMAFYIETKKQTIPRSVIITPTNGMSVRVTSDERRRLLVLKTTSVTIDLSKFLYPTSDTAEYISYAPKLSIKCYDDDIPNVQSSISVDSGDLIISNGTSVPLVCIREDENPRITSLRPVCPPTTLQCETPKYKYYAKDSTKGFVPPPQDSLNYGPAFDDYLIISNQNSFTAIKAFVYCSGTSPPTEVHSSTTILGLSFAVFTIILVVGICCCCWFVVLLAFLVHEKSRKASTQQWAPHPYFPHSTPLMTTECSVEEPSLQ